MLQLFAFDDNFTNIHSKGSAYDATHWYQDGIPQVQLVSFIAGSEDLCILEQSGRIRNFSFISQSFRYGIYTSYPSKSCSPMFFHRPAMIQLPHPAEAMFSAPDGSALLVVEKAVDDVHLRAFHTNNFGATNEGIVTACGGTWKDCHSFSVTSLEYRENAHVVALHPKDETINSLVVRIGKNTTDFQYQSKDDRNKTKKAVQSEHNCIIDCVSDVWTRYPVVPAIKRYIPPLFFPKRFQPNTCVL